MWEDPIVAEVRANREAYAKRFSYDLKKIVADLIKKQEARAATAVRANSSKAMKAKRAKAKSPAAKRRKAT